MSNDQFAQQCLQRSRLRVQQLQGLELAQQLLVLQQVRQLQQVKLQVRQLQQGMLLALVHQRDLQFRLRPIASLQRCHVHYRQRRCRCRRNQLGLNMQAMDHQGADH